VCTPIGTGSPTMKRGRSQPMMTLVATETHVVQVHVMSTMQHRNALFGSDELPFDEDSTVFVWSGRGDPFTKDEIGERMIRFLILVAVR
jgi:hypothetical protein